METLKLGLVIAALVAFVALSVSCEVARWRECRRVHPFWYCAMPRH